MMQRTLLTTLAVISTGALALSSRVGLAVGPTIPVQSSPATTTAPRAKATGQPPTATCPSANTLSNREAARQLLFLGFVDEPDSRLTALGTNGIGGFYLMGARKTDAAIERAKAQLKALASVTPIKGLPAPFVAVDEEGGRVQRLAMLGKLPSAREMAKDPAAGSKVREHAKRLRPLGINMVFAPVLDLDTRATGVISDRSFSGDPDAAWATAKTVADAWSSAGVTPVFKHFPGHGAADGDSHTGLVTTPAWSALQKKDVRPFASAVGDGARVIMMGHLLVPGLTQGSTPTTWTPAAYQALRALAFEGLIITDDLGMGALKAEPTIARRASRALTAGADMVLVSSTAQAEATLNGMEAELKAGTLSRATIDKAVTRVLSQKCGR
jgi:beta-N-acetylhexosaminidase